MTTQKGFIIPLIVIIVVAAAASAGYYQYQSKVVPNNNIQVPASAPSVAVSPAAIRNSQGGDQRAVQTVVATARPVAPVNTSVNVPSDVRVTTPGEIVTPVVNEDSSLNLKVVDNPATTTKPVVVNPVTTARPTTIAKPTVIVMPSSIAKPTSGLLPTYRPTVQPTEIPPVDESIATKLTIPNNQTDCINAGGEWGKFGLRPNASCHLKTTDAGKVCNDFNQCQGECVSRTYPASTGVCSSTLPVLGCFARFYNGTANPILCMD